MMSARPAPASVVALMLPLVEPPRTTFGAPTVIRIPRSRARRALLYPPPHLGVQVGLAGPRAAQAHDALEGRHVAELPLAGGVVVEGEGRDGEPPQGGQQGVEPGGAPHVAAVQHLVVVAGAP